MELYFAPMHGVTLAHYRNLHAQIFGGIDKYYAPFIVTTSEEKSGKVLFKDVEPDLNDPQVKVIPQLLSNNCTEFNFYAEKIASMGYDEINWNIGCPFPTVTNKRRGSGLLEDPDHIKKFLKGIDFNKGYAFSVKMRLGFNELEEGIEVMERLNKFPISDVTIHGRTGIQKYEGSVDLGSFNTLYALCKHQVIYNGDINTPEDLERVKALFPEIDRFMIGRGLLKNPFLGLQLRGVDIAQSTAKSMLYRFHNEILEHYVKHTPNERYLIGKMKEFWTYLAERVDPNHEYLSQIRRSQTLREYRHISEKLLTYSEITL